MTSRPHHILKILKRETSNQLCLALCVVVEPHTDSIRNYKRYRIAGYFPEV